MTEFSHPKSSLNPLYAEEMYVNRRENPSRGYIAVMMSDRSETCMLSTRYHKRTAEGLSIQVNMTLRHQPLYNSRTHVEESRANMTLSFIIGQPVKTCLEITTWEYDKAVRLLVCVCV